MQLFENIALAVAGLRANKMRALLTMLGIIIGIGSVITIVTLGDAMTGAVMDVFNSLGANSIQIYINDKPDENGNIDWSRPYEDSDYISDEMIDAYKERFGSKVEALAVSESVGNGQAQNGRRQAQAQVIGVNDNALGIQNIDIVAGHDLNEREVGAGKYVAVISDAFVEDLFPNTTPQQALGREVKLRVARGQYTFTVVGVYHFEVNGMMAGMVGSTTSNLFIPVSVAKEIADIDRGYSVIQIKASSEVTDTVAFAQQSEDFLNRTFYRDNKYVELMAMSMDSMLDQMTSTMDMMKVVVSVIAAISLLVGGIGVMNIMLVSVTERTREIGTRKALGAKNSAIRIQFIVESMIICVIGGAIGVVLGTTLGRVGSLALGAAAWPSPFIILVAVGFSMAIGIFFGYYPANKAAKLDPIEALRYE